ncbi:unnamed protein product [Pieris macdunnoughi]|uniref:Intraflagellar transport protein 22 homolog n=1 Tax=Pieris macdunnoughi TaxID=345717 RepID=A0A821V7Q0_9NEOP|nr:unnamed protein product [Pieris macdunnoughi]
MQIQKLKILMIGPSESGKSLLANFISEAVNFEDSEPRPTQGVRIVEFELPNLSINDKQCKVDIELWDCSGDHKFESCWPALRVGVNGVIFVCSSNSTNGPRELELLYNYFVSQPKLSTKQCVVFCNCTNGQEDDGVLNLSPTFSRVSQVAINMNTRRDRVKLDFINFVSSILQSISQSEI